MKRLKILLATIIILTAFAMRASGRRIDRKPTPSYLSTVSKTPDAALHKSQ